MFGHILFVRWYQLSLPKSVQKPTNALSQPEILCDLQLVPGTVSSFDTKGKPIQRLSSDLQTFDVTPELTPKTLQVFVLGNLFIFFLRFTCNCISIPKKQINCLNTFYLS